MSRAVLDRRHVVALTLCIAAYALIFLRLQTHWWFEDDPYHIAHVSQYRAWEFFVSKDALARGIVGLLFTPLQNLTYWIDGRISPPSPGAAYLHTTISLWLAMLLWRAVLSTWLSPRAALAVVIMTLLLPVTVIMAEFVSLRNYLDGLCLALAGIWCAQRALSLEGPRYWLAAGAAAVFALLGALAKEIYVTTPFALILILFLARRRWVGAAAICAAGVAYLAYYRWLMGSLTSTFNVPTLTLAEYPDFLWKYPYIFAGSPAGWALAGIAVFTLGIGLRRQWVRPRDLALVVLLAGISFATMHPAAGSLGHTYDTRGTWYRASFGVSLTALAGAAWLIRAFPRRWRLALGGCALVTLALGATLTVRTWDELHAAYGREGRFYLANPDKLVYSEVPAWWFLVGVDRLYEVPERHFILAHRALDGDAALLRRFGTVWRYSPVIGAHFPAPDVFRELSRDR
jgi:hypothetical protein